MLVNTQVLQSPFPSTLFLFDLSLPSWLNHMSSHLIPGYSLFAWILHEPFNVLCTGRFGKD